MPAPNLTPKIGADGMRDIVRKTLALWRSQGQGGVTITKSESRWIISAEAPIADPVLYGYIGAAFRHNRAADVSLGIFPAGNYVVGYKNGAYIIQTLGPSSATWAVQYIGAGSGHSYRLIHSGGSQIVFPDAGFASSWATMVANYSALNYSQSFTHTGGEMLMRWDEAATYGDDRVTNLTHDPAEPPVFGVSSNHPKLAVEDQATEEALNLYMSGASVFPRIDFTWTGDPLIHYSVQLHFSATIPSRNYLGGGAAPPSSDGCYLFYGGNSILFNSNTGAIGDMETVTATVSTAFDTDALGAGPVADSFWCHWRDGMAMTGCAFEISSYTVISKTRL